MLSDDQLAALLATCAPRTFADKRDEAILRLFLDTGMRLGELAGLTVDDVDLQAGVAYVIGKGSRPGPAPSDPRPAWPLTATCAATAPATG